MTWVQRVIVYFISVVLLAASVRAEEMLEKDSGRFLG